MPQTSKIMSSNNCSLTPYINSLVLDSPVVVTMDYEMLGNYHDDNTLEVRRNLTADFNSVSHDSATNENGSIAYDNTLEVCRNLITDFNSVSDDSATNGNG